jgi:hypothetical protein
VKNKNYKKGENVEKTAFSLFFCVDLSIVQCYNGLTGESVKAKKNTM